MAGFGAEPHAAFSLPPFSHQQSHRDSAKNDGESGTKPMLAQVASRLERMARIWVVTLAEPEKRLAVTDRFGGLEFGQVRDRTGGAGIASKQTF